MTQHEKTIKLINSLGMSAKKIADILGKSQSVVYNKIKLQKSNKFLDDDFAKILSHCEKTIKNIKEASA